MANSSGMLCVTYLSGNALIYKIFSTIFINDKTNINYKTMHLKLNYYVDVVQPYE